jgi:hypothetical protein
LEVIMRTEAQVSQMLETAKPLSVEAQHQLLTVLDNEELYLADDIASGTRIAEGHGEVPIELGSRVICGACGEVEAGNPSLQPAYHPTVLAT